jgi:hypothetical protein
MKHLPSNFPDLKFLSKTVHGLMECHPDVAISKIVDYVNSWSGIAGKLNEHDIISLKHSA